MLEPEREKECSGMIENAQKSYSNGQMECAKIELVLFAADGFYSKVDYKTLYECVVVWVLARKANRIWVF